MRRTYPFPAIAGIEPKISEMLEDQTMHLVLARDGLCIADLEAVIRRWRTIHMTPLNSPAAA